MPRISIVVPAFNEEALVGPLVEEIHTHLDPTGHEFEVVLVDDGSTDGTWERIVALAEEDEAVRGLHLSRRFGKESAIAAGLDRSDADAVVVMDADGQHPPAVIVEMIQRWEGGARIVHGRKREEDNTPLRRAGASLFYGLSRMFSGISVRGSSDFKLLDRRVVGVYQDRIRERNRFFRVSAEWIGFRRDHVDFRVRTVRGRRSRWSVLALCKLAVRGLTSYSSTPLLLPVLLGVVLLAAAGLIGLLAALAALQGGPVHGHVLVIGSVFLTGGLILLSLGVVGEYVATIHEEVKRRPIYVVEEQTGRR